jgi:hypothetical protein
MDKSIRTILIALIISFITWLSFTVSTTKTSVVLLESKFSRVDENSLQLKSNTISKNQTDLLIQNHELRIQILEKNQNDVN